MYNTFLKIFATTLRDKIYDYINDPDDLSNLDPRVIADIKSGKIIEDENILRKISEDPKAILLYIGYQSANMQKRAETLRKVKPDFEDTLLDNWQAALWFFDRYYQDNTDNDFFKKFVKEIVDKNYTELVPGITRLVGRAIPELEALIFKDLKGDLKTEAQNDSRAFQNFRAYVTMLADTNINPTKENLKDLSQKLDVLKEYLRVKPKSEEKETKDTKSKETLKLSTSAKKIINLLNDATNNTISQSHNSIDEIYKTYKENLLTKKDAISNWYNVNKNVLSEIELSEISNKNKIIGIIKKLLEEPKAIEQKTSAINHRSKRMIKANIVKAYTKYYIKNFLPGLLKQASPDMLPQVVNTGVQEVQNMMYGDNVITDFNNPVITNQISTGIQNAVKDPDLIPGGAADGMTLEGIAQKWAPIYNIPVEQLMPILEKQLAAGMVVELEHTNNNAVAREIALDHLTEAADYYSYLENMEHLFPEETVGVKVPPEPENFQPEFLENPNDQAPCNGHCGDNCQGHCHGHDEVAEIKPQTVEDKLQGLNDGVTVLVMSDEVPTEVEPGYDEVFAHIDNLAKALKR